MAVSPDKPGPYTAASAILQFLGLNRSKGLPATVNAEVLGRAGIPESLIPRTLQALQTLDLISDEGAPTPTLEALRRAPEAEYKARMAEWLNDAYADVLQFVDPAGADEVAVRDAFRNYSPVGQQSRMVSLFMALYSAAGVRAERTTTAQPRSTVPRARGATKPALRPLPYKTLDRKAAPAATNLPPTITALLGDLPPQGGAWTQEAHDKFLAGLVAMLDYNYTIVEAPADEIDLGEEAA